MGLQKEVLFGTAKQKKAIDFLGKGKVCWILSMCIVLVGVVFMIINKVNIGDILNYSLEFKGGTSTSLELAENMSIEDIDLYIGGDLLNQICATTYSIKNYHKHLEIDIVIITILF